MENLKGFLTSLTENRFLPETILTCLKEKKISPESLEKYMNFDMQTYTRNLVCKNENFEMLLLCWEPGHTTAIHDHASQGCWMTVLEGIITSENYTYVTPEKFDGTLDKLSTESFKTGESYYIDDSVSLHLLRNPLKAARRAATLHIYAKPFSSCTAYNIEKKSTECLNLIYHSMGGQKGSWLAKDISQFK